jgi:hypothetical protein
LIIQFLLVFYNTHFKTSIAENNILAGINIGKITIIRAGGLVTIFNSTYHIAAEVNAKLKMAQKDLILQEER